MYLLYCIIICAPLSGYMRWHISTEIPAWSVNVYRFTHRRQTFSRSAAWIVAGVLEENPCIGCHHQVVKQGQPEVDVDAIQTAHKKVVVHPRSTLTQWPFHSRYKAEINVDQPISG